MTKLGEKAYIDLLASGELPNQLLGHSQFFESFVQKYDELSYGDKYDLTVAHSSSTVSLTRRGECPEETDGVYRGAKDVTQVRFRVEEQEGHEYLRVDRERSLVHTYPGKGQKLTNSLDVEVYEGTNLLGRALLEIKPNKMFKEDVKPHVGFEKPELTTGHILSGLCPKGIEYAVKGDYTCSVAGRESYESGLVERSTVSRTDGRITGKTTTAAVNVETPNTIDNAADFVVYDKDMNMRMLNPDFKNPTDAKKYYMERYAEAIKGGNKLAK